MVDAAALRRRSAAPHHDHDVVVAGAVEREHLHLDGKIDAADLDVFGHLERRRSEAQDAAHPGTDQDVAHLLGGLTGCRDDPDGRAEFAGTGLEAVDVADRQIAHTGADDLRIGVAQSVVEVGAAEDHHAAVVHLRPHEDLCSLQPDPLLELRGQPGAQLGRDAAGSAVDQLPPEAREGITQLQQLCEQVVTPVEGQALEPILSQIRDNAPTELQLPDQGAVTEFCNGLVDENLPSLVAIDTIDIECDGDSGRMSLAGTTVLGAPAPEPLQGDIPANTKLFAGQAAPLADAVQVTFNRQTKHANGAYSVDGVVVELGGGQGEIILGHTTCGEPLPREAGRAPARAPRQAEAPQPVQQNVPVTG